MKQENWQLTTSENKTEMRLEKDFDEHKVTLVFHAKSFPEEEEEDEEVMVTEDNTLSVNCFI